MFPQQPQQQFRTAGADVQIFYGSGTVGDNSQKSWVKPRGVSHIYMMLIGAGGNGDGSNGGGSGAVTVWYGAAQHVPDNLIIVAGTAGGAATTVSARFSNSSLTPTALLTAEKANNTTAATAMSANQFTASGFFQSVAGQNGGVGTVNASPTTFLSAGGNGTINANYGYSNTASSPNAFFMLQPIIVGVGAPSTGDNSAAIGCGGGITGVGGPGMVLIASW